MTTIFSSIYGKGERRERKHNVKRIFHFAISTVLFSGLLAGLTFSNGFASSLAYQTGEQAVVSFSQLGQDDLLMKGPYSFQQLRYSLPANWAFQGGATLQLRITTNRVVNAIDAIPDGLYSGAEMSVTYNNQVIATLPLRAGEETYDISIPESALLSVRDDGRQVLVLFLDAGVDCENPYNTTTVVVSSASQFVLPYIEQRPETDLTRLPFPIYQADSVFPVNSVIVVPDSPTTDEMQAALIVAAGFGRMTRNVDPFQLVPVSQLTQEDQTTSNLIFIGKASNLSVLSEATLPVPLKNGSFTRQEMQPDDGIVQMTFSPWNDGRSVLVVSGNSDAGVVKAAKAFSTGEIQTGNEQDLAIVADAKLSEAVQGSNQPKVKRTFGELGYDVRTISGVGRGSVNIEFYIPPGFNIGGDAYLDLTFLNSATMDYARSGLTVFLNSTRIGSLRLSDETASTVTQRFNIPASSVLPGNNRLIIEADLVPLSACSTVEFSGLWVTILPESILNLPLESSSANISDLQDLDVYPYPFIDVPMLSNVLFVLSPDSPSFWAVAADVATGLGRNTNGSIYAINVAYDGDISDDMRMNNHIIAVGLPQQLDILKELESSLPVPFEADSNTAVFTNQQVVYRFSPDVNLGYLELLPSPWNTSNTILVVTGNSNEGGLQAGRVLFDGTLRSQLRGNFALIKGEQIVVADTRIGLGLGDIISESTQQSMEPITTTPSALETLEPLDQQPVPASRLIWIPVVVVILLIAIVVVLGFALLSGKRKPNQGK